MGAITDLLLNARAFAAGSDTTTPVAVERVITERLKQIRRDIGDFDYPSGTTPTNEVQQITKHADGTNDGTYTLTVTLPSGTFTTADIAYDAANTVIQAALATAVGSDVIAVTGGPLSTTTAVFTYSGTGVSGRQIGQISIDGSNLLADTDPSDPGTASTTTQGQTGRSAWAVLMQAGLIKSGMPTQGDDPTDIVAWVTAGKFPHSLDNDTVIALCEEAALQDGNDATRTALLTALGL